MAEALDLHERSRVLILRPHLAESSRVRAVLRTLAADLGFSPERCFDMQVAVGEAVANAIEHAGGAGEVLVEFDILADRLEIRISGPGDFRLPSPADGREHRGLGLPLMASLSDHLALYSRMEGGTLVSLTFHREGRQGSMLPPPPGENLETMRRRLETMLFPDSDLDRLELGDVIDAPSIQSLMNHFYSVAGIPMAVLDTKGRVLVAVGWQDICTNFHRVHPEACGHCIESDTELTADVSQGQSRLYKCKNNMWDIATPIVVGGRHLGNVFSGQFFFEDEEVDYDLFRAQARRYGFDERAYLEALEAAPRLSREAVDRGVAFLVELATMLSQLGLTNVQLARAERERSRLLAQTTSVAETLQEALVFLPSAVPGVHFGHAYRSATEAARLGGDFFDVFALPGGEVGIIVGDVSGKGVIAAHLASFTREAIRAFALHNRSPRHILRLANEALIHRHGHSHFVTVSLVLLDPKSAALRFSLAGHPPPLLLSASGVETLPCRACPPLGAFDDARYATCRSGLGQETTLVFYTDGITEARRFDGRLFGEEGLVRFLEGLEDASPELIAERVLSEVASYGGGGLRDDAAVLALTLA